ncbi:NAD(P)/FAD-dependent oxidoreductase [Candidatus Solincola sp.]|nr:FAD-dependent oxidoreductase [Actinomycetota bacterium]MDI7252634.1 FAD-dependent oxidoreductase [Actinomycetota bacterium]
MELHDVIIIGAGPAGLSAGVYCARKMLDTLVISSNVGGQAAWSWEVENYLGYQLISGAELVERFRDHLENFKVQLLEGRTVVSLCREKGRFRVATDKGEEYYSKAAIAASGKVPRKLGVPGEDEFRGRGVAYCATCDAPLFRGRRVAVVGGGNSALDAALQLAQIADMVHVLTIEPTLDGDEIRRRQVLDSPKVEVRTSSRVLAIRGTTFVEGIEFSSGGREESLEVQGVFIEIGSVPSTAYLPPEVELNPAGEIVIDANNRTSLPGLFAAGDVTTVLEKQIIIAAGEGAKAALSAYAWLVERGEVGR